MHPSDALQWLNLLLIPMAAHIIRTEGRINRMEAQIELMLERLLP
ncbi:MULTISPECIES: hypothetical protein [unclassified Acidovorax]|nr:MULTISPECIES: hypothetical protein [unclassified Acidovorax]GKS96782.1 hypothetical protein AVAK2825_19625 [Acidovorax sp. SUPP2825]GKT19569.1 hypothetical protein AVHY2522_22965 [Acidovorax sp. SUPP2522]